MNLKQIESGPFDATQAIRFLAGRVAALEAQLERSSPSATMDGGAQGGTLNVVAILTPDRHELEALFPDAVARLLIESGFHTADDVARAEDYELRAIGGIGPTRLAEIRQLIPRKGES